MVPTQDYLGLGSSARFNTPGTISGNWVWRLEQGQCTDELAAQLKELVIRHSRLPDGVFVDQHQQGAKTGD